MRTFRLCALANLLAVTLQEQIRADARVELLGNFRLDCLLRFAVCHTVVVALLPALDSHDHVRAVGRNGSYGSDARLAVACVISCSSYRAD